MANERFVTLALLNDETFLVAENVELAKSPALAAGFLESSGFFFTSKVCCSAACHG